MTAQGSARTRFNRALDRTYVWGAEEAAREMGVVSLDEALRLVYLYAEAGSPKYERAAMRWMQRYLAEGSPRSWSSAPVRKQGARPMSRLTPKAKPDYSCGRPRVTMSSSVVRSRAKRFSPTLSAQAASNERDISCVLRSSSWPRAVSLTIRARRSVGCGCRSR